MHKLRVDESEAGKLSLVDVGDDQLVWRSELGLGAREELVKVLCSFATLKEGERETGLDWGMYNNMQSAERPTRHNRQKKVKCYQRSANRKSAKAKYIQQNLFGTSLNFSQISPKHTTSLSIISTVIIITVLKKHLAGLLDNAN